MRLLSAIVVGILLAVASPLSLPDIPLPAPWGAVPMEVPGWDANGGYGQLSWLAFLALIPLFETARRSKSSLHAFGWGYLTGFIWLMLHWLWLQSFGLLPVVLMALWFGMALGVFTVLARSLIINNRAGMLMLALPALWVGLEYFRSFGMWAFPWNLLGYTQAHNLPVVQVADLGGIYALSFLIVLVNAALWLLLTPLTAFRYRLGYVFATAGVLLLVLAYGELRLSQSFTDERDNTLTMALVQGGVNTRERWSEDRLATALNAYVPPTNVALTDWQAEIDARRDAVSDITGPHLIGDMLVVWPEVVLPRTMDPRNSDRVPYQVRELLAGFNNAALIIGAAGRPYDDDHALNGFLLIESNEDFSWPYSKVRLVPYGEVVPLKGVASFLDYPWGSYDMSAGTTTEPLHWRGHVLGLGICFDNVFGFLMREQVRDDADMLLLITNNSWYKLTGGIRQHCDMDILRAVEYRRPVVRVSTSGWSHHVAPTGRTVEETEVNAPGLLTATIAPGNTTTFYLVFGDILAQLCLIIAVMLCGWSILAGKGEGIL